MALGTAVCVARREDGLGQDDARRRGGRVDPRVAELPGVGAAPARQVDDRGDLAGARPAGARGQEHVVGAVAREVGVTASIASTPAAGR